MSTKKFGLISIVMTFVVAFGIALAQPALADEQPVIASGTVEVSGEAAWDGFSLGVVSSNGTLTQSAIVKDGVYTATVFVGETVKVFHEHKCANLSTPLVFTATVGADLRLPDIVVECRYFVNLPIVARAKTLVEVIITINGERVLFPFGIEFRNGELLVGGLTDGGSVEVEFPEYGVWSVEHDHPCPYEPRQVEVNAGTSVLTINLTCK